MEAFYQNTNAEIPMWMQILLEDVDGKIVIELKKQNREYQQLREQQKQLCEAYACVNGFLYGEGAVSLDKEEHQAVLDYLQVQTEMDAIERKGYYQYGHSHCYEYMRRIGAFKENDQSGV